ncbi:MAG: cytochrome c oxidase subunit II [Chloroflexi bacterium]|nr:cytochrome c oxidase subunit II [Chloroflexota bacterium]
MRVTRAVRTALRRSSVIGVAVLAALLLAACATRTDDRPTSDSAVPGLLPGQVVTEQGRAAADLYLPIFVIAVAVFVLVEGLLLVIALRFRRRKGDDVLPSQTHGNNLLEVVWTAIPALIVTILFIVSTSVLMDVEATSDEPAVTVDVTGFQWQWTFDYPAEQLSFTGAGSEGPEMVVPINESILIRLHALDVIHSFYVPQFFRKLDLVPGRVNQFEVTIEEEGTFGGQCAEFCGLAHDAMYFTVRAVDRATYDQWVADEQEKARQTPPPLPSGGPAGSVLQVTSISTAAGYEPTELTGLADTPLTIQLDNPDPEAPHNVAIRGANPDGSDWIGLPIAGPGQKAVYTTPPMPAGAYTFYCSVHANMTGTLTLQ